MIRPLWITDTNTIWTLRVAAFFAWLGSNRRNNNKSSNHDINICSRSNNINMSSSTSNINNISVNNGNIIIYTIISIITLNSIPSFSHSNNNI